MSRVEGKKSYGRLADIRRGKLGLFEYAEPGPYREPCFWCGTRGDLGCKHQGN